MKTLIFEEETYAIWGACFEVYKEKGCGFHEAVIQECLALEFSLRSIPSISKPTLTLQYKGRPLATTYQPDFVCFGKIILEIKAVSQLADEHKAQVLNYLKASGFQLGLLANFGHHPQLEKMRLVANEQWAPPLTQVDLHA